ncbi:MAG: hypothetical protein QXI60_08310 [Thermofilaceae archaeon]
MGTTVRRGMKSFYVEAVFYYHVECSNCSGLSGAGLSPEEAIEIAIEGGWREMCDGRMICPACDLACDLEVAFGGGL